MREAESGLIDAYLGQVFDGRYRIETKLGSGGSGTVYAATQLTIDRPVALKVLRRRADEELSIKRFYREARAAGLLTHANTVRLYDCGCTDDGTLYMVTERLHGETLADRLQQSGPLPPGRAAAIARAVLDSLGEAHRHGLIHRDIKPDNVFLVQGPDGGEVVKVLDFGMVKLVQGTDGYGRLTQPGTVGGTPAYMSPENVLSKPLDSRADLYSVGVMLYQMLTGRLPFQRDVVLDLLLAHARDPVPPMENAGTAVPEALASLVMKCLAKAPADRPATAEALREALDRAVQGLPEVALPPPLVPARSTPTDSAEVCVAGETDSALVFPTEQDPTREEAISAPVIEALVTLQDAPNPAMTVQLEPPALPPIPAVPFAPPPTPEARSHRAWWAWSAAAVVAALVAWWFVQGR